MKTTISVGILALLMTTAAAAPESRPPYRTMPSPGIRHYVYQVVQTINGTTHRGYRTEFDLEAKGGALFAIIRSTAELDNGAWKPATPDPACRKAMNGTETSLARAKLYPGDPKSTDALGAGLLAECAPPSIFFPLTDILNVMIIPVPGPFRASELRKVGEVLSYPGFTAAYDRAGEHLVETTNGGEMQLVALDRQRAILHWRPRTAELTLVEKGGPTPVTTEGTEHYAFRVEVNRPSGFIERASATYDDLDLKIVGAPDSMPHIKISRAVTIERR